MGIYGLVSNFSCRISVRKGMIQGSSWDLFLAPFLLKGKISPKKLFLRCHDTIFFFPLPLSLVFLFGIEELQEPSYLFFFFFSEVHI